MADQNNSPLTPQQAQQLSGSGMLSPETASLFPSTPENQEETAEAQVDQAAGQAAMAQAQASLLNQTRHGIATSEIGDVKAALEAKRLQQGRDQQEAVNSQIADSDLKQQQALIEEKIRRANEAQAFLIEQGIPSEQISSQLQELQNELQSTAIAENSIDSEQVPEDPAISLQDPERNLAKLQAEDTLDLQDKTQNAKNSIMDQMAQVQGEVEAIESQRAELEEEQREIFADAKQLKEDAKGTADDIWSGDSVGTKIMAGLAIALGAYKAELTGGPNRGLEMVNQIIDRQVAQKQQSFKNQLALKSQLIDKTMGQLRVLDSQTASKSKKMQILSLQQQLEQNKIAVNEQLIQQARKSQLLDKARNRSISPQEQEMLTSSLSEEERQRVVRLPNGLIQLADSEKAASKLRDIQAEIEPAIDGANRILELADSGSRFNLEDRAKISTELSALVGQLRIPFTGPGILTDKEYERLKSTIGDPNALFALPSLERMKLVQVITKLQSDINTRYKQAGIAPIKNENSLKQQQINSIMKQGVSYEQAVKILERSK